MTVEVTPGSGGISEVSCTIRRGSALRADNSLPVAGARQACRHGIDLLTSWIPDSHLLVEHIAKLTRRDGLVDDPKALLSGFAKKVAIGFSGKDDARDRLVEQDTDSDNGISASLSILQAIVGDHEVRTPTKLAETDHSFFNTAGGQHLVAPVGQDGLQAFQHHRIVVNDNEQTALAVGACGLHGRRRCRLLPTERQFDAKVEPSPGCDRTSM